MTTMGRLAAVGGLVAGLMAVMAPAQAQVQITEWMYNGNGATGEYIEFTNLGPTAVDFTGWSFDDDSRTPGVTSLSAIGLLAPGASAVLTEAAAADFRNAWGLGATSLVIGSNAANLGRTDEINLFGAQGQLIDRLTYSDQTFVGTVRAQNRSGNPLTLADLQPQTVHAGWVLASAGDAFGSWTSSAGDVGNPGSFALAVPEPATWAQWLTGALLLGLWLRKGRA